MSLLGQSLEHLPTLLGQSLEPPPSLLGQMDIVASLLDGLASLPGPTLETVATLLGQSLNLPTKPCEARPNEHRDGDKDCSDCKGNAYPLCIHTLYSITTPPEPSEMEWPSGPRLAGSRRETASDPSRHGPPWSANSLNFPSRFRIRQRTRIAWLRYEVCAPGRPRPTRYPLTALLACHRLERCAPRSMPLLSLLARSLPRGQQARPRGEPPARIVRQTPGQVWSPHDAGRCLAPAASASEHMTRLGKRCSEGSPDSTISPIRASTGSRESTSL